MRKKRSANATYEVGFGKPPIDKQFQKGKAPVIGSSDKAECRVCCGVKGKKQKLLTK